MRKNILWALAAIFLLGAVCNIGFSNKCFACEDCDKDGGWF